MEDQTSTEMSAHAASWGEISTDLLLRREHLRQQGRYALADALFQQHMVFRAKSVGGEDNVLSLAQFTEVLGRASILDTSRSIGGGHIWLPYGLLYQKLILERSLKQFEFAGYLQYQFPCLIDVDEFERMSQVIPNAKAFHVYGLDRHYVLKPTGEAAVYPVFRHWLQGGCGLPLRVCQIGPYFRPRKHSSPYLRSQEYSFLLEAHSAHASSDEMNLEFQTATDLLANIMTELGLAFFRCLRPRWTNRLVAEATIGLDVVLPWQKTIQTAVSYCQGQIFSRAFDVRFRQAHQWIHTFQTTFGFSEKTLLTTLLVHCDELGLRIPPMIAPYQVILLPVGDRGDEERVIALAHGVSDDLRSKGIRSLVEDAPLQRNAFLRWVVRGAPLQILVSTDSLSNRNVEIIDRFTMQRETIALGGLSSIIPDLLNRSHGQLARAQQERISQTPIVETRRQLLAMKGPCKTWLCRKEECVRGIEETRGGGYRIYH